MARARRSRARGHRPRPDRARSRGRPPVANGAAEYLAEQAGGYPYAIQLYGHHAWRASQAESEITLEAATAAARSASIQLARGLYAQRWSQASPVNESTFAQWPRSRPPAKQRPGPRSPGGWAA
jgi:hypothetical protein